jgi:hypothetical protein
MSQKHFQAIWQTHHFNGDSKLKDNSSTPAVSNLVGGGGTNATTIIVSWFAGHARKKSQYVVHPTA